jgi:hypothetical protein
MYAFVTESEFIWGHRPPLFLMVRNSEGLLVTESCKGVGVPGRLLGLGAWGGQASQGGATVQAHVVEGDDVINRVVGVEVP